MSNITHGRYTTPCNYFTLIKQAHKRKEKAQTGGDACEASPCRPLGHFSDMCAREGRKLCPDVLQDVPVLVERKLFLQVLLLVMDAHLQGNKIMQGKFAGDGMKLRLPTLVIIYHIFHLRRSSPKSSSSV